MDLATFQRETDLHRQVYEAMRDHIREDYRGKYVAFARGQLIAVTPTFDEARKAIDLLQPVPEYFLVFPADMEPSFELSFDF